MNISEALTIDLSEDIKNVIDIEDLSETEIKSEIENYIVTDGLAREYSDFVSRFTSNILETGVWISGFYGSGKSYFGKILGYMLSNRLIAGTPARDRIVQRIKGISDEELTKNEIAKLGAFDCRVVFLDIAKQDTSKGLAYTLFQGFLRSLNLPENEYGYSLLIQMYTLKKTSIEDLIGDELGKEWSELRRSRIDYAQASKDLYCKSGKTDEDYNNILASIRRDSDRFGASSLKEELQNYLSLGTNERIIFLFDEASEAINQGKFDLLQLEGLSESLSSLGGDVWTIAIAQERLDDVINNANINLAQLTKVTDRFKTKIHLEATEVDVIIRERLLSKTDDAIAKLKSHFKSHSGKIADHSSLTGVGVAKTDTESSYLTYYPFYKNQFDLLQNFLFGTKGYASTKVAARGMIITTYEILKRQLANLDLFSTPTAWQISKEAQPQPPIRLVNRFDTADQKLSNLNSVISGRKLLETINFLNEAEVVTTSLTNIAKAYVNDPDQTTKVQPEIESALKLLLEAKILLHANGEYRITSDIEQRLLDEMKAFAVQTFVKKKTFVEQMKDSPTIKALAKITDNNLVYDFYITTDSDDEITNPKQKDMKLKIKSLYNLSENRETDVNALKNEYKDSKETMWLVPKNDSFKEIDATIDEITRIDYIKQNYQNPGPDEAQVIQNFLTSRSEKEARLKTLIESAIHNGSAVYLFNEFTLNEKNWQAIINERQREIVSNIYSRRLDSQLSDDVAKRVIKEANPDRLHTCFAGPDFQFFDKTGNFVGESLKPSEELLNRIRNTFVDGAALEKALLEPPNGFQFGTVVSTAAALMRGGKLIAKFNGVEKFSWRDEHVDEIFSSATKFRQTSFKAIAKSLSAAQKTEIVKALQDLEYAEITNHKVDWNTNDFDLATAVKDFAQRCCDKVEDMSRQHAEFDDIFKETKEKVDVLQPFTTSVTASNYVEKAEAFIASIEVYSDAVISILQAEKFVSSKLPQLRKWKSFIEGVTDELEKAAQTNETIRSNASQFQGYYNFEVESNFNAMQKTVQKVKDEYFNLMKSAAEKMAGKYTQLKANAEKLVAEISLYPDGLNEIAKAKADTISQYSEQRTISEVEIDWDVKDKQTKFTYSEMLSFIELYNSKKTEIDILRSSLIHKAPEVPKSDEITPRIQTIHTRLPGNKLKVREYRAWLQSELQKVAGANDTDEIEIEN